MHKINHVQKYHIVSSGAIFMFFMKKIIFTVNFRYVHSLRQSYYSLYKVSVYIRIV